jgi:hypothetical protein
VCAPFTLQVQSETNYNEKVKPAMESPVRRVIRRKNTEGGQRSLVKQCDPSF